MHPYTPLLYIPHTHISPPLPSHSSDQFQAPLALMVPSHFLTQHSPTPLLLIPSHSSPFPHHSFYPPHTPSNPLLTPRPTSPSPTPSPFPFTSPSFSHCPSLSSSSSTFPSSYSSFSKSFLAASFARRRTTHDGPSVRSLVTLHTDLQSGNSAINGYSG